MKAIAMSHKNEGRTMGDIARTLKFSVLIRIISLGWIASATYFNYLIGVGTTTTNFLLHIHYPKFFKALGYQFSCCMHVRGMISFKRGSRGLCEFKSTKTMYYDP